MSAAVLLYTMRCNIACAHCSVDSSPERREKMDLDAAVEHVRQLAGVPGLEFVDVSGGEAMLHRRELAVLARAAVDAGLSLRIVSNGYWAITAERAASVLAELVAAGVSSVGLSIDLWHLEHLDARRVGHYVAGCRAVGMQPLLSGVLAPDRNLSTTDPFPDALAALLRRYDVPLDECLDLYSWAAHRARLEPAAQREFDRACAERTVLVAWQPLTAEGRAVQLELETRPFAESSPEPCDAAGELPTIDEEGRLFPCCAPWISRKSHAISDAADGELGPRIRRMREEPLVRLIHTRGPQVLVDELRARGRDFPETHSGICNQCGLLLDRVPLDELRRTAAELVAATTEEPG